MWMQWNEMETLNFRSEVGSIHDCLCVCLCDCNSYGDLSVSVCVCFFCFLFCRVVYIKLFVHLRTNILFVENLEENENYSSCNIISAYLNMKLLFFSLFVTPITLSIMNRAWYWNNTHVTDIFILSIFVE